MSIGNSMQTHQDRIIGAQIMGTMNARRANADGSPDRGSAKYRALRYELQSEGLRAFLYKRLNKA